MLPYSYLVLGVDPVSNEANVELQSKITITFAKPINTDTLNATNIRLRKVNGEFIEYTGQYKPIDKNYTLTPVKKLEPNTQYQTMILGGTDGVLSVDGGYLPGTKTYEFVTVPKETLSNLSNLVLNQDYLFISAHWDMPGGVAEGEGLYFNVRLSTSNNPEAADLWPSNPVEGKTTATNITIPYKLEAKNNYYVHVQAVTETKTTDWLTQQIYIEPIAQSSTPSADSGSTGDSTFVPSIPVDTGQLMVIDHSPRIAEMMTPSEIVVVFNDAISESLFDNQLAQEPLFYVVEAIYKKNLSIIDKRGTYSVKNAIEGSVSVDSENPNVVVFTPTKGSMAFIEGKDYTVILSKNLAGTNKLAMGIDFVFGFTSHPEHLHGDIEYLKEVLSSLSVVPSDKFLQSLMKKHSQYACDIWYESSTYDESLHQNGEAPYYIHQYVNTQVLIDALLHGGMQSASIGGDESVTLGNLTVSKSGASSGSSATSITDVIAELQSQLKDWEDLIHGHHNRGYANPSNVVKGESASTLPAYITRTTMNTEFDA